MSNELQTLEQKKQALLERQAEASAAMRSGGSYISFKNAQLKVDGMPVPNNTADVRVLAAVAERAWYEGPFDSDVAQVPSCYALDNDVPHDEAQNPQSDTCATCDKNKWGSAPPRPGSVVEKLIDGKVVKVPAPNGKGKACREGARVIVVPANVPLKSAPMYTAKIPVTSIGTVQAFSSRCAQAGKLTGEFVAALSVVEDKKFFFKVHLTMKEVTNDMDMALLMARQDEAYQLAVQPYPVFE